MLLARREVVRFFPLAWSREEEEDEDEMGPDDPDDPDGEDDPDDATVDDPEGSTTGSEEPEAITLLDAVDRDAEPSGDALAALLGRRNALEDELDELDARDALDAPLRLALAKREPGAPRIPRAWCQDDGRVRAVVQQRKKKTAKRRARRRTASRRRIL